MKRRDKAAAIVVAMVLFILAFVQGGRVTKLTPTSGSLLGATRLTIHGEEFAKNQFNQDQKELGNIVTLVSVSRAHVVPCDVITYYTTPYQIVCTTRPSPSGEDSYNIRVSVDGKWLDNSNGDAYCGGECVFKFTKDMTPTITSISPKYGLPGTLLTIRGRMFTDQVMETEEFNHKMALIERVYAGAGLCQIYDSETKELYGLALDKNSAEKGYIKCKPVSTIIGSQRASFLVSAYGRSQMTKDAISVDSQDRLYLFQTHADVTEVNPSVGSTAGGTIVTVTGKGFEKHAKNAFVQVAGVPCRILSIENDGIKCQTSKAPSLPNKDDVYPGARGLLREVWKNTRPSSVSAVGGLSTTAPDYHSEVIPESSSPAQASFGESSSFSDRYRGFFVPPSDNNYTFYIQADDQAELYLSLNDSAAAKTKIASCSKSTTNWAAFPEQKSAVFSLKRGRPYYIEALHVQDGGKSHVTIGVKLQKTRYVNSQIGAAVNEKQEIRMSSVKHPEIQVINITSWDAGKKFDVQQVEAMPCKRAEGNNTVCTEAVSLNYGGMNTAPVLLNNMTANNFQRALNNLTTVKKQGHVNVTEVITSNNTTAYRVTFYFNNPENTQMLRNNSLASNITSVKITRLQKGVPANYWFRLSLAGRITSNIHINAQASDLKQQLQNMTTWYCSYQTPPERAYYFNGFESSSQGPVYGERVFNTKPNCGRFSLKNPRYLFYGGQSKDMWGRALKGYDVARYKQLCFSYKGNMKDDIDLRFSYTDKSGVDQRSWRKYSIVTIPDEKWHQLCINIHDQVINDVYLSNKADMRYNMYVEIISVTRNAGVDLFVDDVFIWRDSVTVQRLLAAAEPGGNIIESIDVQKLGPSAWSVSLTPYSCGTGIGLMQVAEATLFSGNTSSDQAIFKPINATENSNIVISHDQVATPPIGGTFDLLLENEKVKGIPANVSADGLKSILEDNFNVGKVSVSRVGTCASYTWTVEWATTGGDQPTIRVDGTWLTGNKVSIQASTINDGGMFLRPIPGDMLRVAETKPQVTVILNNIPSSCSKRNCSFTFSSSATPALSSVSPQKGTTGTEITLTGSDFSSSVPEVNVTIGGVICHVTSASLTTIKCTAGQSIGGFHEVVVKIANKGFAKPASGKVTFVYQVMVSSIQPARGSSGGGTLVAIKGNGFGVTSNGTHVTIGGSICDVINSSLTELSCVTSSHAPSNASVDVMVGSEVGSLSNAFVYDAVMTPSVSSLSIPEGSVSGGEQLVIQGSGFGLLNATVKIGPNPCKVTLHYDVLIKCTTPANAPGIYDVLVYIDGKGYAVDARLGSKPPQFKYVLEMSDISPRYGSIFGGTVVTVTGRGFSDNTSANVVTIGDVPCEVLSCRSTTVMCKTGAFYTTYNVDNTGQHPEYGLGYAWNPQTVVINVGDFVQWKWTSPELSGLSYGVQQTRDSTAIVYDGKGFKSARSGNGNFSQQFNVAGTYFYSSGAVDPYGAIIMKGRVIVKDFRTKSFDVEVQVGGVVAPYNASGANPSGSSSPDCQTGVTSAIPQCAAADPLPSNLASLSFTFWKCSTPEVTSISPNSGTSSTILTIKGSGFGVDKCLNEVKIGSRDCTVQSSTENEIKCLVTTGNRLTAGIPHSVSVRVNNRGSAAIKIAHSLNASFTLQPTIQSVSPQTGSVMGGSILTINGNGFSSDTNHNDVQIAGAPCSNVKFISYTQVLCQTSAKDASQALAVDVKVNGMGSHCDSIVGCSFTYSAAKTPKVDSVTPSAIVGNSNTIRIYGSGLTSKASDLDVKIGDTSCVVTSSSQYLASCQVGPIVAGKHDVKIHIAAQGFAMFESGASSVIESLAVVSTIAPIEGSIMGGTELSISGSGFDPAAGHTTVKIGVNYCAVVRVTSSEVVCRTSAHAPGSFEVVVTVNSVQFPRLRYAYRTFTTPYVTSISPASGKGGQTVTISGSGFSANTANMHVTIANTSCIIVTSSNKRLTCVLGSRPAGIYDVILHVKGKGLAAYPTAKPLTFLYEISLDSITPNDCGLGGGKIVSIKGYGFDSSTTVKICDNICRTINSSLNEIYCEVPAYTGLTGNPDIPCLVSVVGDVEVASFKPGWFTYRESLTSRITSVSPSRGGTGGGVQLTIKGNGFSANKDGNKVTVAGVPCKITSFSQTEIRCITGPRSGTIQTKVRVEVGNQGIATQDNAEFHYIDVWSSRFTWGYKNPPGKGDGVVISKGQTILLDVNTPVFSFLVIRGELIFDEKDITLNAKKILVVDGGKLQVGTEMKPFQHKARIVLHGHMHNKRLPIFGTKVLAVREGTLDLHGKVVPITWTHLANTARPGDTQLVLKQAVTWTVDDQIVLASTSRSQKENEEFNITSVSNNGRTIGISPSVKHQHISLVQTIAGRQIETRAEVGLLTRNVVVEGSENDEWSEKIEECPEGFDPGIFAVQTCFQGRYGGAMQSEQFGSQIMINARRQSQGLVMGRISYVEVRKAGQAFGLGRYPIHFHLSGDVSGSYVRGCAIHHTFNRAVTVHGVTGLVVEHNVAYHVMGHAFFIEDGIETGNTIQYNLGVYVQTSSTLLTTDVTPATFWVTNPNNTIRHNAAAGGSHHGFWYNLPNHPGGPSYTTSVCPKNAPLGEFQNNTAHSFGRYGVWIFLDYFPMRGGGCGSTVSEPAKFYTLLAYNNLKGFEVTNGGAIQTINFTLVDNKEAGFEFTKVAGPWGENGPLVKDSLVVGHSAVSGSPSACTQGGLVAPQSSRLTVSRTTFVNFNVSSCAALRACSFCKERNGGFSTRFEKIRFLNSPNKAAFQWEHEAVFEDLDGTLTGLSGGGSILPSNPNLPPEHCSQSQSASVSSVSGSVCDATLRMRFRRLSWNNALPSSLMYRAALLANEAGTSRIPWRGMRVTHDKGWMATVILGQNYNFTFDNAPHLTNISYSAIFYEMGDQDFIWMTHPMKQTPDIISTNGKFVNMTSGIPSAENASNGDWYYNNISKQLTYIVSGKGISGLVDRSVKLKVERCYFKNCIKPIPPPPPEKRPIEYLRWSDAESWYGTDPGYGGYNKQLPQDGDDVIIKQHWWMVADSKLPSMRKLFIYGTLELEPHMDFVLNATYIVVGDGGNLIIGWEDQPMKGSVLISLNGNHDTPDIPIQDGPNVGSKAIGVFGNLEIHGLNRSMYWTRLTKTADVGSNIIHLEEAVDWRTGDEIVIAPTSFEPYDTEIVRIVDVHPNRKTLQLNRTLKYKHLAEPYSTGDWNYTLAAEVGLLTRNIVIEGADDAEQVLDKQSFGCRVLIGSFSGSSTLNRRVRVENVEFRHCGQEGWSDAFDPRYSLALLDVGNLKGSYIRGNSFHDGFNTAIGVFGIDELAVLDNVIHHTVGSSVRVYGRNNKVLRNLAVLSVSPATYKGRHESENQLWHASFDISEASQITVKNNAAAGSERIGFHIRGESCYQDNSEERWDANTAHTSLHGIHIGYHDGLPGCLKIANFVIWKNWDFGIFGFPSSRVIVQDTIVADSNIGILVNVWAPSALSHRTADKFVRLDRVLIVGTSPSFDCVSDMVEPRNSGITQKVRAPRYRGGGNTGFVLSTFSSSPALAPEFPWHSIQSAPAIRGVVKLNDVAFAHFGTKCGRRSVVFTTNPSSPDAFHPVLVQGISLYNVDKDKLIYIPPSNIGWINPSDCVDMDCDGAKHVLIKDLDGSLTGVSGGSVISKAEYEWNGDPRRGLGDYRIPRPMLTSLDGSRLNASIVAPHHGIVRGTRTQSFCSWNATWNVYKCFKLDYHMFVIESLDADTELRRLSPVALSSNGYTDLLNGPMDHGCCFGYACMERLSTFYSVVAAQNNYTVYFTGTNPQNLRLTLLNADNTQAVRVAIWYSTPRRLDVYRAGVYMYPTNAKLNEQNFSYKKKNPNLPDDQFEPLLSSINGANYYERESQLLYVVVRGNVAVDIRTAPVIQVKLGSKPVHFNDFFEKNLIQNLATILNIDESRIRVVEIVNAAGNFRRRRRDSDDKPMTVTIEIGDPPQPRIPYTPEDKFSPGNSSSTTAPPVTMTTTASPTQTPADQYVALQALASKTVEAAQTGRMASLVNLDILSVEVIDPEPPRKLPKGWKRATPEDAGPKNGTWRFDQVETMKEENKSSPVHDYLIPVRLVVMQEPDGANETVPFLVQPKLVMVDKLNRTVNTLGHGQQGQWYVTATIKNGTGDPEALLGGNTTVPFIDGWANFTNLNISHNATGYVLKYTIIIPLDANFTALSQPFEVKERVMYFTLVSQPRDANETVPFGQQPLVEVRDAANGELVTNTGWKGRKWICKASLVNPQNYQGKLNGLVTVEFSAGVAAFTDLSINYEGKNYVLNIEAYTVSPSRYQFSSNADPFDVKERVLALVITQQPGDCNDTVSCGSQPILEIRDTASNTLAGNLGWRGRTWTIQATMEQGAGDEVIIGQTQLQIPRSGYAAFSNISFYDVASGYKMKFEVTVTPHSQTYSGMVAISHTFDVNPRQFYLAMITQASNANQSVIFGTQPVVEVRDLGTGMRATPLKTPWRIVVSLYSNPKLGKAFLNGTFNISVVKERAVFTDLLITVYGRGYVLKFESNYGQSVLSSQFEVHYVNDYSPVFAPSSGNYIVNISEAVSIGFSVINIQATDNDKGSQGDVYYALIRGNIGSSFNLNRTSGAITTARKLDRETTASYNLIVKAFDGAVQEKVRYTTGSVIVNIGDINDNAPQFAKREFSSSVNETADLNDVILRVKALDRDTGTNSKLKFSITSGNDDGYFDVMPGTGDIVVKKSLDLESASPPSLSYRLGVHVTDMGVPPLNNSTYVSINISPVNEFSPQFTHRLSALVRVKENQETGNGLALIDVNATDKDFGLQGVVRYFISSGNNGRKFQVNSTSGVVMLISPLDYETEENHTLIIRASDSGEHARYADFTLYVQVDDVNDNAPEFKDNTTIVEVPETLSIGQTAATIQATDRDSGDNGRVSYSIASGDSGGFFSLDYNNGILKTRKSLDLESARTPNWTFTLVIVAKDHGDPQLSGNESFVLKVSGVNEFTPQFTRPGLSLQKPEDTAVGSTLCHVTATDKDFGPDGLVTYQIAGGNDDRRFRIDSSTGQIYVHAPLDREKTPTYHLNITASDRPTQPANQRSSFIFVDVSLTDVNDNRPVFKTGSYYAAVKETAGVGDSVITVQATDADAGTNGQVEYRIKTGNSHGFFEINAYTGTIQVKNSLDLETQQHIDDLLYTLTVEAFDKGSPVSLSQDVPVTIEIQSVNEFPPKLQHLDSIHVKIPENTAIGSKIADINATDKDFGLDGKLTYSIFSGNEGNKFAINPNTGVITVNNELDYETVVRYSLGVRVSDNAPPAQRLSTVAKVTVRLTNINDSGGVDVLIHDVISGITPPGDLAEVVGVATSSPISVVLLYESGEEEKLTADDSRLTFDDKSESRGLFTVVQVDGKKVIKANRAGLLGQGFLIVRVHNVYNTRVKINVVGYSSLQLKAVPYPLINQSNATVTSLKRIGSYHGNYQQAALKLYLVLNDNTTYDVTTMASALFIVVSNDAGVKVSLGPSLKNVLSVDQQSTSGKVSVCGKFSGKVSPNLGLEISADVIMVNRILAVELDGLNHNTLLGLAYSTQAQIQVSFLMNDSSVLRVQDFVTFSGLVSFTISNAQAASVDSVTGVVTLKSDYHDIVTVTVTPLQGLVEQKTVHFYCNTVPPVGGVDIGQEYGAALPALTAINQKITIPVRVNQGKSKLLAYDIKISYDDSKVSLVALKRANVYSHTKGLLHLADVTDPDNASSHIADLVFDTLSDGVLSIQPLVNVLIDHKLDFIGNNKPAVMHCTDLPLGDVTADCVFDIQDAAFTMAYSLAQEKEFVGEFEQSLLKRTTTKMLTAMDFNINGVVERHDAFLLARANLDMVRFIRDLHMITPDHRNETIDCTLGITAKLSTRSGSMGTNTQVFFEFASSKETLSSELRNTAFDIGKIITTYENLDKLFGGIIKAESQDKSFQVKAKKSQIEISNMGLSMVQVTKNSQRLAPVVTPFFMYARVPMFPSAVRVSLAPNTDMVSMNGHSPQLTVNITESYATCQDPPITNNVMFVFQNDYKDVQGKEDSFTKIMIKDLTGRFPLIKIKNVRLAPGSILVYFDVVTQKSQTEDTLVALWDMVKSGYTLRAGDTEYQAKPVMRVGGTDYYGNDKPEKTDENDSKFPVGVVVSVCVGIILVVIGTVVCLCYRKRFAKRKEGFKWKSASKINILDSRSTSRMSDETRDHEMILFSGLSNDHFECSDDEVFPSPVPSSRTSSAQILKPEENIAKWKLRKVESASSQASLEAWTGSSSPALIRHQMELTRQSPQLPVSSSKFKVPSPVGTLLTKQTSDSQLLTQENSSTEGSPFDLSPRVPKRGQSPNKRLLVAQNSVNNTSSDSSDEEHVFRSNTSSPANAHTTGRRSLTPQVSGSKLKDHGSEAFVFDKAVLYKRLKQENGSKHSSQTASRDSSRSGSGYSTPRVNVTSLPPGFVGNGSDGNDITVEEESYTVRLPVNVLNTVKEGEGGKPFTKIGFIEFPSDATLSELRKKLKKDLVEILQGKSFLFQDAMMADVEPSNEETTKSMYNLSVIVRFANDQEATRLFCPCGAPAHFQCSACFKRGYCGRDCQLKDWRYHKITCESEQVSSV